MFTQEVLQRAKEMKEKRTSFLIDYLNPHEKEMKEYIGDLIKEFSVDTLEGWERIRYLIPDCGSKLMMDIHFRKL